MGRAWSAYGDELAAASLVGLPVCVLMAWVIRRCLGTGAIGKEAWCSALLDGLLLASVLPFAYATLSHGYGSGRVLSLVPLAELSSSFGAAEVAFSSVTLLNVGGNAALLAGLGALLPLRSRRCASLPRVAAVAVTLSATVEIAQYALDLGRVCSTDDVLLNTLGAIAGALVTRHRWRRRSGPPCAPERACSAAVTDRQPPARRGPDCVSGSSMSSPSPGSTPA